MLDIFRDNAFSTVELTDALLKVPFKPQRLGQLGIFTPRPIRTAAAAIEKLDKVLSLVQTTPRGAPYPNRDNEKRDIRDVRTNRVALASKLRAEEIAGVRQMGAEELLQTMQDEVMSRMVDVRNDIDLTLEHMRLGAIQGVVLDANGDTIIDWFDFWGISAPSEIDFDLDNASPASGALLKKCAEVVRGMSRASKGAFVPGTQIRAECGDTFFDQLVNHSEVRATYLATQQAPQLRDGYAFGSFTYGGITFENYRGTDDGSTVAVNTLKAKFYPVGARNTFAWFQAPGESFDDVNQPGREFIARVIPDEKRNEHADIEVATYPLFACLRPEMLYSARNT